MNKSIILLFLFILSTTQNGLQAQNLDQVLNDYFSAVGGKERWSNIQSRVDVFELWTQENMLHPSDGEFNLRKSTGLKLYKQKGIESWDRVITIPHNSLDTFTTCYNGKTYWGQAAQKEPIVYDYFIEKYKNYVNCGEPCFIINADSISFAKEVDDFVILKLFESGDEYLLYFDKGTNLLMKSHQTRSNTITLYKNYQSMGDFKIPFVEEVKKDGILMSSLKRNRIVFNLDIDDSVFNYPKFPYHILTSKVKF